MSPLELKKMYERNKRNKFVLIIIKEEERIYHILMNYKSIFNE